jgi:hypothetical protein
VLVLAISNPVLSGEAGSWTDIKPVDWNAAFPACRGNTQSPINIITNNAVYDEELEPFTFHNYNTETEWNVTFDKYASKISLMYLFKKS